MKKSGKSENLDLLIDFTILSKINISDYFLILSLHHKVKNIGFKTVRYYFYFSIITLKNYVKKMQKYL